ncbi:MAG TPA: hypothetical protein VF116_07875 [Ktedonobacterales bacterium]
MWDLALSVTGRCPECGDDLSDTIHLRAPSSWLARYYTDERLRRGIDRSIERLVLQRHERACAGKRVRREALALPA